MGVNILFERAGFFCEQVNPRKAIAALTTQVPILFTHGKQDDFTPTQMSIDMWNTMNRSKGS